MQKVLIANRGEIALRVARACWDEGLESVAVYADADRDALHARYCDEAFSLDGQTAGETYLRVEKLLDVARRSQADAVHPGYGFLSENADFAQAVNDAGLTWIGPPPEAIRSLGDKVTARHIAREVGAPLAPGTPDPVSSADEVVAFAREHGLPVAIKAAHGGGGRGLKIANTLDEVSEKYASAVREAEAAFGRGECFVERYLERPRHVEAQVLADMHGNVVVVGTRDCSLQRRHQKLVEEAPAPFLTETQVEQIHSAAAALAARAGYVSAGTVEFLVATNGEVSFLEVNTRLQVEHPVTEEVTGLDLVREQFRVADGQRIGFDSTSPRGHSIEFRINGEDPGRNFMPTPGVITAVTWPSGPGVRIDAGVEAGSEVSRYFDSLLAKIVVTGRTRTEALARARRALGETRIEGVATVLPFFRALVEDSAFAPSDPGAPFGVHTRWIETESDIRIPPFEGVTQESGGELPRETLTVEVNGKRYSVAVPGVTRPAILPSHSPPAAQQPAPAPVSLPSRATSAPRTPSAATPPAASGTVTSPMQGTIVNVAVSEGQSVEAGETLMVLEAMKMEQPIMAPKAGSISQIAVSAGDSVSANQTLCVIA